MAIPFIPPELGQTISNFNFTGIVGTITAFVLVFIFLIFVGVGVWVWAYFQRYKYRIVVFENLAGQGYVPTRNDRAMIVKIGTGGEIVLYLRKNKLYRSAYGRKTGKNTYTFTIGSDGYWYNTVYGSLDKRMSELGIEPIDRDMRYMSVAIRKNIEDRFNKKSFWEKYGASIIFTIYFIIVGVMTWLVFDKFLDIANAVNTSITLGNQVLDRAQAIIGALDNLQHPSNIIPAP